MMSETALRDLNTLPSSDRKNESSSKGSFAKPFVESANENVDVSLVSTHVNGNQTGNAGPGIANSEVEYIDSENLIDVEDIDTSLKVQGLMLSVFVKGIALYLFIWVWTLLLLDDFEF